MERFVGDIYEGKMYEYTVVAKVSHPTKEGVYVYMIEMREFGTEKYSYHTEEY